MHIIQRANRIQFRAPFTTDAMREYVHAKEYYSAWPCKQSEQRMEKAADAVIAEYGENGWHWH